MSRAIWSVRSEPSPATYEAEQAYRWSVFEKIAPKDNWKMPIRATIDEKDFAECENAAYWFTGGGIEITQRYKNGRVRVRGAGYYACIGA